MLTIHGEEQRFCDGVSRRQFLQVGGMALGGLTLADLLAAEARAAAPISAQKSVIMVYLPGEPPHQDTFDLKPEAPSDFRGEFKPIETSVPGIRISEHLPKIAGMMERFAIVRSLVGARDEHANPLCLSGYPLAEAGKNHPSLGSSVSRIFGPASGAIPPFVDLIQKTQHKPYAIPAASGFLGRRYGAARLDEEGAADMSLKGITLQRLGDRRRLLESVDTFRRSVDGSEAMEAQSVATQQAFSILTSSKFVEALDVSREPQKVRDRYGKGQDAPAGDGCSLKNEQFLAARRLVEAGVRCVTLGYGFWDFHGDNFGNCKRYLPMLDQAVAALAQDLHDRGLDRDVSVVVWGDFGRTPKINKDAGRDHWPAVSCALLAGGGMKMGQVIGSTTADGGYADERPVHYRDVLSTVLHQMGFDTRSRQVVDQLERPVFLYPDHEPIPELV
ncbi:MAG TPA: DUF1501 domain-containing protein [Armatimonadota bacterium]|nr:DUF1501 domain-containing protein [Armatimonadota bacterium]